MWNVRHKCLIAIVSLGAIAVHSDHFYGSRRRFHTISFLVDTVDFLLNDVAQAFLIHFDVFRCGRFVGERVENFLLSCQYVRDFLVNRIFGE